MTLYAMFAEKSVYDNPIGEQYLQFSLNRDGQSYSIKAKQGILYTGKVTLPIVHPTDGMPITAVANEGFKEQPNITHIFWERKVGKTNQVNALGTGMCQNDLDLCYFEMPELVTAIPDSAFYNCHSLFKDLDQEDVDAFFRNITSIGYFGCMMIGTNGITSLTTTCNLSHKLVTLGQASLSSSGFAKFTIGSPGNPSQLSYNTCGIQIFSNAYVTPLSFTVYAEDRTLSTWSDFREKFDVNANVYSVVDA